jgi:hypothetical protein
MIITLKQADFSSCKIGTLTTVNVRISSITGTCANVTIEKNSVEKSDSTTTAIHIATISLNKTNYKDHVVEVKNGTNDVTSTWYSQSTGKVTIPVNSEIKSNITISVSATAVSSGNTGSTGSTGTSTMYTFTINPTPTNATVTLTASSYTQSGNSITVPSNTSVAWKVSASGYTEQSGTHKVTKDENMNIALSAIQQGDIFDLSTISYEKTSDVTYNNGAITGTGNGSIINDTVGTKQTIILKEPLVAGQEIEVSMTNKNKKFVVIGLNDENTLESLKTTACYSEKIMATPVNLYFDPSNSGTIMSFESSDSSLNKPVCSGDGSTITRETTNVYTIIFKRDDNGNITAWQKDKGQIIPPADAPTASNPHTITTQWNNLNSKNNTYLCIHGINGSVSYSINYFGKLRQ